MRELWTVSVSAVALALCSASLAAAPTAFTETYRASGSGAACDTTYGISGAEPNDGAKHPVFIYVVGTVEIYYNAQAMAAVKSMAARASWSAALVKAPSLQPSHATLIRA